MAHLITMIHDRTATLPKHVRQALQVLLILLITAAQWELSELSVLLWRSTLQIPPMMILVNMALLFLPTAVLALLTRRWHVACAVTSVVYGLYGIVNSYTYLLHGAPLTLWELKNAGTALNVLSGYDLTLTGTALEQCILCVLCLGASFLLYCLRPQPLSRKSAALLAPVLLSGVFLGITLFSPAALKPRHARLWSWTQSCQSYGYAASLLENTMDYFADPIACPEGYSAENAAQQLSALSAEATANAAGQTPDVIFILNESFYDLSLTTDITTDVDPLKDFYAIENAVHGYAVVPQSCGGTNKSEYELLTGNSMNLIRNQTPFQILNLENANSVVSLLGVQGYTTLAAHIADRENYNRVYGYQSLGFDEIYFEPDFENAEKYFGRGRLDSTAYKNLIRWYEAMPDAPRLCYLLTCQNHGGYDLMDDAGETVHIQQEMGEMTHQINEYLTCVQMSVTALQELLDYYSTVERPVVVCMVGDHAPSFTAQIASPALSDVELDEKIRSTPFIIWANYPIQSADWGTMDLTALSARCLGLAGVDLSPYFTLLNRMPQSMAFLPYDLPAATDPVSEETDWLNRYYWLEYNNMVGGSACVQELFAPVG